MMKQEHVKPALPKEQVTDQLPKRFKAMKFGIQSIQDVCSQGVIEISQRQLYDIENPTNPRAPVRHGALDSRLGISSKIGNCETCDLPLQNCMGHFGHVRLSLPAFHIGYLRFTMTILQGICKTCARILLTEEERRSFLKQLRQPGLDNLRRTVILKQTNAQCRKCKICPYCQAVNGQIRKHGVIKLAHDKFVAFNKSTAAKKVPPESKLVYDASFRKAKETNADLEKHVRKAMEDLNPLRVLNLFKLIPPTDCELLGMDATEGRPEMFIWQYVPAPPICIRPSVQQDSSSTEDDLTAKLSEIIYLSGIIRAALDRGQPIAAIMEQWEYLQLQIAMYVNSEVPGLTQPGFGKTVRGLCQRLKGKQGRFRGNLSGKRVDFSGRTVISPDPNLSIDQVAVPDLVAKNMTYPERVNSANIAVMRAAVRNGQKVWPGANGVNKQDGNYKVNLKFGDREKIAKDLKYGDVVERHLVDGDIALFNRQPSLHKLSIMSHFVKVRPWRTFRLNECVCGPYNADFDGDEMNLHIPQTEEARAEAMTLMGVKYNLATPKNGEPIIAATQDFITAAYLLSRKDNFYNREQFTYVCEMMLQGKGSLKLPPPAIIKPGALWTGKQLFSLLIRPNDESNVMVNLDAKCKDYTPSPGMTPDMCPNDGWLVIRNSEVMCGVMDKSTVGAGKKDSIFYVLLRDFGPQAAADAMDRLSRLCARSLTNHGFSIGVGDVFPQRSLTVAKDELVRVATERCESLIKTYKAGKLEKAPGCNLEETLENAISGILSKVRSQAGDQCVQSLSSVNAPLIMAKSGSKGSTINVAQMVACVGQQIIGGARVADGFQDRTLPHFKKGKRLVPDKGFVANSFYTGLLATEFLFHAISGREGLVDTAVKTAETGYMSRRLMKSLEDLSTGYDETVRTSAGGIVQFQFGADNLDPVDMEAAGKPVHFDRTWTHAEALTWDNNESTLLPREIIEVCRSMIEAEKAKYPRRRLTDGIPLDYDDDSDLSIDEHESARRFLREIEAYVAARAKKLSEARREAGLNPDDGEVMKIDPALLQGDKVSLARVDRVAKVSLTTLKRFIKMCLDKYKTAHVEPGHAVGAVGAQSIGEPGTQMTLKTFHFAGVAGMSITQGVPRIKEIINASKTISTPVITCPLENKKQIEVAKVVKARIEKTYVKDVIQHIEDEWHSDQGVIILQIDMEALSEMHLGIGLAAIADAIFKHKKMKISREDINLGPTYIEIYVRNTWEDVNEAKRLQRSGKSAAVIESASDLHLRVNYLRRVLPNVAISGYPEASRAVIQTSDVNEHTVLVEGYGFRECMTTEGVIGTQCRTNNVLEARDVLGVEAARTTIANEIAEVMGDMGIDPRHMQLLADVMTYKGEVLGITRFGLQKMRDSVLQLASFEKTADHLFEAAAGMKTDRIEGVSECIIMGQTMAVGTGSFGMVRRMGLPEHTLQQKETKFEDEWAAAQKKKKKREARPRKLGGARAIVSAAA